MDNTLNPTSENSDKPKFSTVKKAIHHSAELLADLDGKKKPKKTHYEQTFKKLREIKKISPELLEKKIIATAKDKDLKDEMGPDLYSTFQMIRVKVSTTFSRRIREAVQQMNNEQEYYPVESREKLLNSLNEIIGEMAIEIKKDPLVRNSFITEREKKLLDKAISQATSSILAIVPDILTQEERLNKEKKESRIFGYDTADDLKKKLLEEKPGFGTVRRVINEDAKSMASKEFLEVAEQRHIDAIISNYKLLRDRDSKLFDEMMNLRAKEKEMSDEIGPELNSVFGQIWDKELIPTMKEDISAAMDVVYATKYAIKDPTEEEDEQELTIVCKKYLEEKSKQLRKDSRIITAFAGKEALLNKLLDLVMSTVVVGVRLVFL